MATTFADHLPKGDHASRPAAADVPSGALYSCTDHFLIYQSDGVSTWSTWATLAGSEADDIPYDNGTSGLSATDVQAAIDEVDAAFDALIAGAPGALDTLNELAAALDDDAAFATTVTNALAGKQPLDSDLTSIAALTTTSFGRALLELADAAAARTALEVSSTAQNDAAYVAYVNSGDPADIQAAINALPAGGGEVVFKGAYTVTAALTMNSLSHVTLRGTGSGSVLNVATDVKVLDIDSCSHLTLRDFRIVGDANAASTNQRGIEMTSTTDSTIHNVHAVDLGYDGILLLAGCVRNTVSACHVDGCGDDGINIGGQATPVSTDNTVVGCTVTGCANGDGIHVSEGSLRTTVVGNVVTLCGFGIGLFKTERATIVGNTIYDCTRGIATRSGPNRDIVIHDNVIDACDRGVWSDSNDVRLSIQGNVIRSSVDYGIGISLGASTIVDCLIAFNTISGSTSQWGIWLSNVSSVDVVRNQLTGLSGGGVRTNATIANVIIDRNRYRLITGATESIAAGGTSIAHGT